MKMLMCLVLVFVLIAMALMVFVYSSQRPVDRPADKVPAPGVLLTAEEMTKVLLDNAKIWKFESKPGVRVKKIRFQLVEDGKVTDKMGMETGDDQVVHKIIIVIQDQVAGGHLMRIYQENSSGSTLGSSTGWFSKPLTTWDSTVQTEVKPISLGTTRLLGGWAGELVSGKSYSSEEAPYRINLVIE